MIFSVSWSNWRYNKKKSSHGHDGGSHIHKDGSIHMKPSTNIRPVSIFITSTIGMITVTVIAVKNQENIWELGMKLLVSTILICFLIFYFIIWRIVC